MKNGRAAKQKECSTRNPETRVLGLVLLVIWPVTSPLCAPFVYLWDAGNSLYLTELASGEKGVMGGRPSARCLAHQ